MSRYKQFKESKVTITFHIIHTNYTNLNTSNITTHLREVLQTEGKGEYLIANQMISVVEEVTE